MPDEIRKTLQTAALLGSYVPRQCGIATFTKDLRDAMAGELGQAETTVLAMDDDASAYIYGPEVRLQIRQHMQGDYVTAADLLNINQIDVVFIQHEFGLFGGRDGSHVLDLARNLRMPIITTLHTVLAQPSPGQRAVLRELIRLSDRLVVMARKGQEILQSEYGVPEQRIVLIPHGIHDVPFVDPSFFRDQFGVEGRQVLLTFGLIGPGKGIEVAIRALPRVVERHPNVIYIVLGATHPNLLRHEGNAYRNSLERLVDQLGLNKHVMFHNRFVTQEELARYISVADIYILPYPNKAQVTSGTLAYALGAGKPVISTPFWHAEELLADGHGRFFDFGDFRQLADQIIDLLENETERHAIRKRAYLAGRPMIWKEVARQYIATANQVLLARRQRPRRLPAWRNEALDVTSTPDLKLDHLHRLTDSTGILQHAIYSVPDRNHGYCADDNARALIVALMCNDLQPDPRHLEKADIYLAFLHHAFNRDARRFRNFLSYDHKWLEEVGSEDSHGRCIWALGTAVALAPGTAQLSMATRLLAEALEPVESFASVRAWAFSIVGIHRYLSRFEGDTRARRIRSNLANRLMRRFTENADEQWPWCEDVATYANARLPHALILAGPALEDPAMLQQGLRSLKWLADQQLVPGRQVSLIGNDGWLTRDGRRARFDQQPIEAMSMIDACADAFKATGDTMWFDHARLFLEWFLGNNDTHIALYDPQTGGCRDGLSADGPNQNQGAESTLAWLLSLLTIMDMNRSRTLAVQPITDPHSTPAPAVVDT